MTDSLQQAEPNRLKYRYCGVSSNSAGLRLGQQAHIGSVKGSNALLALHIVCGMSENRRSLDEVFDGVARCGRRGIESLELYK